MTKQLLRSRDQRILGGVCGGIAEYLDVDPVIIRVIFVALAFGAGSGILIYIILWLVIPDEKGGQTVVGDLLSDEDSDAKKEKYKNMGEEIKDNIHENMEKAKKYTNDYEVRKGRGNIFGLILIAIGILLLINQFVNISLGRFFWPAMIILFGVLLLGTASRKK